MRKNIQSLSLTLLLLAGCNAPAPQGAPATTDGKSVVLVSVTSDVNEAPQAVDMAMKLAGFSLDEGRHVAMFFNVKGVHIPTQALDEAFAFQDNEPIRAQLAALIGRGAEIHVCPICMKALGVSADDLIDGAQVTTRAKLFANIGPDTAVFTY